MKLCGKIKGYCAHQDKDSCDGCELMETLIKYRDKSNKLFTEHLSQELKQELACYQEFFKEQKEK